MTADSIFRVKYCSRKDIFLAVVKLADSTEEEECSRMQMLLQIEAKVSLP